MKQTYNVQILTFGCKCYTVIYLMGNSSTFMSYCRSCSIVDDIPAPTLEANFLVEKRTLESLFFNSTSEASVMQSRKKKKDEGELSIQEHSRNEASILQRFFNMFSAIFICIFIAIWR